MMTWISAAGIVSGSLLGLRAYSSHQLPIKPTEMDEQATPSDSPLAKFVTQGLSSLTQASADDSLFYPLDNPRLALLTRIRLADLATHSIDAQYYLFHDDQAGRALLGALAEAAARGVKVRLLLDEMDTLHREPHLLRFIADNPTIQLRIFNPCWLRGYKRYIEFAARFPQVTRRMHNKSYTADQIASVVGGRNIGNEYFDVFSEVAFADLDLLVAGQVGQRITEDFAAYWHSGLAFPLERFGKPATEHSYQKWLTRLQQDLAAYRNEVNKQQNTLHELLEKSKQATYHAPIKVLCDPPNKVITPYIGPNHQILPNIKKLMEQAQQELFIMSAYFIPGKPGMEIFKTLRQRGVDITILTNSLVANDVPAVHAGYKNYRKALLAMGVKLYELKSLNNDAEKEDWSLFGSKRASLHAKSFVIDRKTAFVGSFNLDPRSALHNTEMGVYFDNPAYAKQVVDIAKKRLVRHAYELRLNDRQQLEWHSHNVDGSVQTYQHEPETQLWERAIVQVLSKLPVEWFL
jgi:putative cardiolipin synthase